MKLYEIAGLHEMHHLGKELERDFAKFGDLKLNPKMDNFFLSAEETIKKLNSLEGSPLEVIGSFDVSHNVLQNLKGAPSFIGKDFICSSNGLESLEGAPIEIHGKFDCSDNVLSNLIGGPTIVLGSKYDCSLNELTSLEGAPIELNNSEFICSNNMLKTLNGCPKKIHGDFKLDNNLLAQLFFPGTSVKCYSNVNVRDNKITTLKNCHMTFTNIDGTLFLKGNPIERCVLSVLLIKDLQFVSMDNQTVQRILNRNINDLRSGKIHEKQAIEQAQQELNKLELNDYAGDASELLRGIH